MSESANVSILLTVLALLTVPGLSAQAPDARISPGEEVVLHGTVRAEGLRPDGLLPGALVEVRQEGRVLTTVSDDRGRYRVRGLAPGAARVDVFHLAVRSHRLQVRLPAGEVVSLDLELEPRAVSLAPLTVRARRVPREPVSLRSPRTPTAARVAMEAMVASPGMAESGLTRAFSSMPGEDEPAPDHVLFMRGSTVDARTVILDGVPILTPFHVAGLVSPFEPGLVGDANLYLGGAPSRYGGGLSYLVDVDTRTPGRGDTPRGSASVDGLSWKGSLEMPVPGGGGVLVAGRSLHGLQSRLEHGENFPYTYTDMLLRGGVPLAVGHRLDVTAFRNEEGVRLDRVLLNGGRARWGNRAASATYRGSVGGASVRAVAARSRYEASLPLEWEDPVLGRAAAERHRAALDLTLPTEGWDLHAGLSADRMDFDYRLDPGVGPQQLRTRVAEDRIGMGLTALAAYAEAEAPLDKRVDLRAGLRAEHFSGGTGLRLGPRASLRFLLTDEAALSVSAGRYHQPLPQPGLVSVPGQSAEGSDAGEMSSPARLGWNPRLPVASSTHLVLALDQMLNDELHLGVSGFVKSFEELDAGVGTRVHASGTDLQVARGGERFAGWIGYSLSWFWEAQPGGESDSFSGRHLVSAGFRGLLRETVELGLTVGYGAGLPLSSVALTDQPIHEASQGDLSQQVGPDIRRLSAGSGGSAPLELTPSDEFLRLDLEAAWTVEPRLGGRSTRLRPYVRVLNALDSRDALFHYFDRWREGGVRPVAERPFLPLVGVEWKF